MKIVVLCEGKTEAALKGGLREYVHKNAGERVAIATQILDGRVLRKKLPRLVDHHGKKEDVTGIVALTDVYPDFKSASDAKEKLQQLVKKSRFANKFRAHAAQYELEAWLLPFWKEIATDLDAPGRPPGAKPEEVDDETPPSKHLKELFKRGRSRPRRNYEKPLEARKWLTADRLELAAKDCPELKLFLDSLLEFAGAEPSS